MPFFALEALVDALIVRRGLIQQGACPPGVSSSIQLTSRLILLIECILISSANSAANEALQMTLL